MSEVNLYYYSNGHAVSPVIIINPAVKHGRS